MSQGHGLFGNCWGSPGVTRTLSGWGNAAEHVCAQFLWNLWQAASLAQDGVGLWGEFVFLTPKMLWLPSNTERAISLAGLETIQSRLLFNPFLLQILWAGDSRQGMSQRG